MLKNNKTYQTYLIGFIINNITKYQRDFKQSLKVFLGSSFLFSPNILEARVAPPAVVAIVPNKAFNLVSFSNLLYKFLAFSNTSFLVGATTKEVSFAGKLLAFSNALLAIAFTSLPMS